MRKIELFLEKIFEEKIKQEYDRVIPIVGDEGVGKSTLMIQMMVIWQHVRDVGYDPEKILDRIVWERDGYKDALVNFERRSVIAAPDAARILYRKDAMHGEQKEIEKDMLQSRIQENLILLGFQSWDIIPSQLQRRRAKNLFRVTSRGRVEGYNRSSLDDKLDDGDWPEPDLVDTFSALDGMDIWDRYKKLDREKKMELMSTPDEDDEDELELSEVAEEVQESIENFVSQHPQNKTKYVDSDLIEMEYNLSIREAKKVKKLVEKKVDAEAIELAA